MVLVQVAVDTAVVMLQVVSDIVHTADAECVLALVLLIDW